MEWISRVALLEPSLRNNQISQMTFPYFFGNSFTFQPTLELITCSATCEERVSWSWTALSVCKRKKKQNITYALLLSCQEYPRVLFFFNVMALLSCYPLRFFSAVRKEHAVSHLSYLTLLRHNEVENTWKEMAGPNWALLQLKHRWKGKGTTESWKANIHFVSLVCLMNFKFQ